MLFPSVEIRRTYADSIKKRLLAAGIVTEMNMVIEVDVPMALEAAARRRLLFAIVANEQNEVHRSITVNILHGIPQGKTMTMPLDVLLTNNFSFHNLREKVYQRLTVRSTVR
jgi:hypothetical protein